jgi:hypothetical protein
MSADEDRNTSEDTPHFNKGSHIVWVTETEDSYDSWVDYSGDIETTESETIYSEINSEVENEVHSAPNTPNAPNAPNTPNIPNIPNE